MLASSETTPTDRLARIMEDCIREARALEQILRDERRALENRDARALGIATEQKRARVAALEALEAKRRAVETSVDGPGRPQDRWNSFLSIVGRCKTLNTTNGAIIRLRRQQVGDALRLVSGTGTATYGPSGTESSSRSSRELAAI